MPEHNLEPPRFSRRALERILTDWTAVRAMLMTGCQEHNTSRYALTVSSSAVKIQFKVYLRN